jgi:zinc protease
MRAGWHFLVMVFMALGSAAQTQEIIPLSNIGGLYSAYVVPTDTYHRVDVQLIVLSGAYDDPNPSGTAHLTEHLAAFSADATVLRQARERDIHATTYNVSTVYTNSGAPSELEKLLRLSRAVLDPPKLPDGFADSEIDIVHRETLLGERTSPRRWLHRQVLQNLYGTLRGRAGNPVEDLPNLSLEAAHKFHSEHYVPSNVTLIVSGKIDSDTVADLVSQTFGDTQPSDVPSKPWLDHKPKPDLRSVETIESRALPRDTLVYAKFVDFTDQQTSIDMQGTFFIAVDILNARLQKALYFGDLRFLSNNIDWYFAKNADLELTIDVQLMPGFSLAAAHANLVKTMATLLNDPITAEEIQEARKKAIVNARAATRNPRSFLFFLQNVAADGFPPVTPTVLEEMLNETSDQKVRDFINTTMRPSATAVVLAKKVD